MGVPRASSGRTHKICARCDRMSLRLARQCAESRPVPQLCDELRGFLRKVSAARRLVYRCQSGGTLPARATPIHQCDNNRKHTTSRDESRLSQMARPRHPGRAAEHTTGLYRVVESVHARLQKPLYPQGTPYGLLKTAVPAWLASQRVGDGRIKSATNTQARATCRIDVLFSTGAAVEHRDAEVIDTEKDCPVPGSVRSRSFADAAGISRPGASASPRAASSMQACRNTLPRARSGRHRSAAPCIPIALRLYRSAACRRARYWYP